jgi:uncharacterized linocin/CFP29 family protein
MSEYLMREAAPLSESEWESLDKVIVEVARQFLVGRQFINLVGPLGAGVEMVPVGTGDHRQFLPLQLIQEDFTLSWRDIEASRQAGYPLEMGPAAKAAMTCAKLEDTLIFESLSKSATKSVSLGDWNEGETPLTNVVQATESLVSENFFGPYAVIVSPELYTKTQRIAGNAGMLVSKLVKGVAKGGFFQSPLLDKEEGFVISLGAFNMDLVIGQDLKTAYIGNEGLDHTFSVLESVTLRVKRPGAICKLGK